MAISSISADESLLLFGCGCSFERLLVVAAAVR